MRRNDILVGEVYVFATYAVSASTSRDHFVRVRVTDLAAAPPGGKIEAQLLLDPGRWAWDVRGKKKGDLIRVQPTQLRMTWADYKQRRSLFLASQKQTMQRAREIKAELKTLPATLGITPNAMQSQVEQTGQGRLRTKITLSLDESQLVQVLTALSSVEVAEDNDTNLINLIEGNL